MTPRAALLLIVIPLAGCAGADWPGNIYEGVRHNRQTTADPSAARGTAPLPDYEQYKKEREVLKGGQAP